MIKHIGIEDISVTPFTVSKNWRVPGFNYNFLLLDTLYTTASIGDNDPCGINYTDFFGGNVVANFLTGSYNYYDLTFQETSRSLRDFQSPYQFYSYTASSQGLNTDSNLLLGNSCENFLKIEEGILVEKSRPFIPVSESKNKNGTYKRLIYDQIKNLYYGSTDPQKILGTGRDDYFFERTKRLLSERLKLVTVPTKYYGDQILPGTVRIRDTSFEDDVSLMDDGDGNLICSGSTFVKILRNSLTSSLSPNMGYSVAVSNTYSAVGNPSFSSNILRTGSVAVFKKDTVVTDEYSPFYTINTPSTQSLSFLNATQISHSNFGKSIDLTDNLLAVSTTHLLYLTGSTMRSASGFVCLFDASVTSSGPVQVITQSLGTLEQSQSFGWCVSINPSYLVVGSPMSSTEGKRGTVYLYKSGSTGYQYEGYLTGSATTDIFYGSSVCIDRQYNKIVVGNGSLNNTSSRVYLYESSSAGWTETKVLQPTKAAENLFFIDSQPYYNQNNMMDGFGNSVSIYCSDGTDLTVAVGTPYDRNIREYSGSSYNRNGAVYVFDRKLCVLNSVSSSHWTETRLIGDYDNFHSNRFGHSLSVSNAGLVISSPKYISDHSSSYVKNTLIESPIDSEYYDYDYLGLMYVYTSSAFGEWTMAGKYKPKKSPNHPHQFFGYACKSCDSDVVTGDPIVLLDNGIDSVDFTFNGQNVSQSFHGGFHIFDINDLFKQHHVGNVFYNTGKIVVSSDAERFDHVFENAFNGQTLYDVEYNSSQKMFEKEIICIVNPGEFNYSSNPTAYEVSASVLDVDGNGAFTFKDCDLILRTIYKKNFGTENWWSLFAIENPNNASDLEDSSLFYYNLSASFERDSTVVLSNTLLTSPDYNRISTTILPYLDLNGDGKVNDKDIIILWKYFIKKLSTDIWNAQCLSKGSFSSRFKDYNEVIHYLNELTQVNSKKYIKSDFIYDQTIDSFTTGSRLTTYITTIGLYSGLDLVAVAKLGTPIKNSGTFPLNFSIRFDV